MKSDSYVNLHMILSNNSGFTLIEVLIATILITFGLLGMASVTTSVMTANSLSRKVTTATILAQEKMEELKRAGYEGLCDSGTISVEDKDLTLQGMQYKRIASTSVTDTANGIKVIEVKVYWDKDKRQVALKTVLSKRK